MSKTKKIENFLKKIIALSPEDSPMVESAKNALEKGYNKDNAIFLIRLGLKRDIINGGGHLSSSLTHEKILEMLKRGKTDKVIKKLELLKSYKDLYAEADDLFNSCS